MTATESIFILSGTMQKEGFQQKDLPAGERVRTQCMEGREEWNCQGGHPRGKLASRGGPNSRLM